ncbi:Aldo keto reductase [Suillus discolor]|uniref:Aldo keto reductase n=1 Tax=Suillus discolor TaxID=1912936 RepID=A0A9P7JPI2_9AGAM|nr:Aldo keto reductase [Suillus discolor]KAG2095901.1 Aldo keto reductase [Suillus discolor]
MYKRHPDGTGRVLSSPQYTLGQSLENLALVLGLLRDTYRIPRSQIIIVTKYYGLVANDHSILRGPSCAAIFNAINASLARLDTPYINLLQIHRFDPSVTPQETLKALHDLVQSGKVGYIGASSMRCRQFAMLNDVASRNGWTTIISMQDEYLLLYREKESEMLAYCKYNGIGVIPYALSMRHNSTKGTVLERKVTSADVTIINRVEELSKKKNCKMSQIALAWVASKASSPIVGISSIHRLQESIIDGIELTPEEIKYLESHAYEPKAIGGHL